ncbi:PrsW family intramembrane metalloprotease [Nostoc sp. CMAA1605]|uniref:PrsW family intramembrane metalloprotease n=1 Tax=Nostoc sp. CMAA1605 TaxID=2055159 RepID=UPI001F46988D|nr:PrsW family glutamic-type intramembrane protease [Nostoc sp. CMAA1605]MCF4966645.1 PrsW family intramembrane metalloprotease [Nostoc sp. CMAA1605]
MAVNDFVLLLWAVIPPLLFLGYYYYRVSIAPPVQLLLLLFVVGAVSGFLALGLQLGFETVAHRWLHWRQIQRGIFGATVRQLIAIAPIEEGCKLIAVIIPTLYLQRRYQLRSPSVFFFTIAAALGFTAEENWIYLYHGTATIFERSIGTPVHAMFSAPWGYALGRYLSATAQINRYKNLFILAWINSLFFHALVNIFSIAGRYASALQLLSYGLFPLLLWMFWRMEQLLHRVQNQPPIILISGRTRQHRYWQRGLLFLAMMLGGNAILGLFLLVRVLSPLSPAQLLYSDILWFIFSRFLLNLFFGILAWLIYWYLRHGNRM